LAYSLKPFHQDARAKTITFVFSLILRCLGYCWFVLSEFITMEERELISIKGTIASTQNQLENDVNFWKRATPQAPNNYTPSAVDCPATLPSIRNATSLSENEKIWLELRRNNTGWSMRDFLARANITGLDTNTYVDNLINNASAFPNIGIAISGGGYRALMNGAGAIAAFDNRTINSTLQGHLGGLLQASTYVSGLSGGSWLVGSLYVNNFTSVQDIINMNPNVSGSLWEFSNSILQGIYFPVSKINISVKNIQDQIHYQRLNTMVTSMMI
jgi:hypothetical protein